MAIDLNMSHPTTQNDQSSTCYFEHVCSTRHVISWFDAWSFVILWVIKCCCVVTPPRLFCWSSSFYLFRCNLFDAPFLLSALLANKLHCLFPSKCQIGVLTVQKVHHPMVIDRIIEINKRLEVIRNPTCLTPVLTIQFLPWSTCNRLKEHHSSPRPLFEVHR